MLIRPSVLSVCSTLAKMRNCRLWKGPSRTVDCGKRIWNLIWRGFREQIQCEYLLSMVHPHLEFALDKNKFWEEHILSSWARMGRHGQECSPSMSPPDLPAGWLCWTVRPARSWATCP